MITSFCMNLEETVVAYLMCILSFPWMIVGEGRQMSVTMSGFLLRFKPRDIQM